MSISDADMMLLEGYLDDALVEGTIEHLRERLAAEPELATALARLRRERAMRQTVFEQLEPSDDDVQKLITNIRDGIAHQETVQKRWRYMRPSFAAAACLMLGLMGGWVIREHNGGGATMPMATAPTEQMNVASVTPKEESNREIVFPENQRPYQVVVTNTSGEIVGVQKFHTPEEAQQFKADFERWQQQQQQQIRNVNQTVPANQSKRSDNRVKMVNEEHEF